MDRLANHLFSVPISAIWFFLFAGEGFYVIVCVCLLFFFVFAVPSHCQTFFDRVSIYSTFFFKFGAVCKHRTDVQMAHTGFARTKQVIYDFLEVENFYFFENFGKRRFGSKEDRYGINQVFFQFFAPPG